MGVTNPKNNEASDSFEIVTFNKEGNVLYFIDEFTEGMQIKSLCSYPCKECLPNNPSHCLSCYTENEFPFLQESTCLEKCSVGRYYDKVSESCEYCDDSCLTCSDSATKCLSCGKPDFLHLRGTECV